MGSACHQRADPDFNNQRSARRVLMSLHARVKRETDTVADDLDPTHSDMQHERCIEVRTHSDLTRPTIRDLD